MGASWTEVPAALTGAITGRSVRSIISPESLTDFRNPIDIRVRSHCRKAKANVNATSIIFWLSPLLSMETSNNSLELDKLLLRVYLD